MFHFRCKLYRSRALLPYRPQAMVRVSSIAAIAVIAAFAADALVPGADAARLGMFDSWFRDCALVRRAGVLS